MSGTTSRQNISAIRENVAAARQSLAQVHRECTQLDEQLRLENALSSSVESITANMIESVSRGVAERLQGLWVPSTPLLTPAPASDETSGFFVRPDTPQVASAGAFTVMDASAAASLARLQVAANKYAKGAVVLGNKTILCVCGEEVGLGRDFTVQKFKEHVQRCDQATASSTVTPLLNLICSVQPWLSLETAGYHTSPRTASAFDPGLFSSAPSSPP